MRMFKLVLSDMDNTLLPFGAQAVSSRALAAIRSLQELGIVFAPCTGRFLSELEVYFQGDTEALKNCLAANGRRVYIDGVLRSVTYLDTWALDRLAKRTAELPGSGVLVYCDSDENFSLGFSKEEARRINDSLTINFDLVDKLPNDRFIKAVVRSPYKEEEKIQAFQKELEELCPELDFVRPIPRWFDVVDRGWTKADGVKIMQGLLKIKAEEIIAFGDSENDLGMMEYLPYSVAVANASPAIKAASRYEIASVQEDGVALALEEIARATRAQELPAFLRQPTHN